MAWERWFCVVPTIVVGVWVSQTNVGALVVVVVVVWVTEQHRLLEHLPDSPIR